MSEGLVVADARTTVLDPATLGERATLLQLSTTFCAPCRAAHRVLERAAQTAEGVAHVEVDLSSDPAVGERLGVTSTPTVLVLDADGREVLRAAGVPTLAQVRAALALVTAR